ncbi:MAG: histidine kinase N-terminal 7TM domain-containing protein [Bacillota bacterium]|nr:histidine kinase N-terminal 7TM domain-containing protein [Bacillota bacterium]MDW7676638.1 histidine kinase N-terminal 7TM domain-containing protein [Bacillota bacterium]
MSSKDKRTYTVIAAFVMVPLIVMFFFTAFSQKNRILFYNQIPIYESLYPNPVKEPLHIAYQSQATPYLKAGVAKVYRPDFVSTPLIVIDRDQVMDEITGWQSLEQGHYPVHVDFKGKYSHVDFVHTILAMASALEQEAGSLDNTIQLFMRLNRQGRLIFGDMHQAPVAIMLDHEAAQRIKEGQRLEMVVPEEGTLSFPVGIMAVGAEALPQIDANDLVAAGFRTMMGEADPFIYPENARYNASVITEIAPEDALMMMKAVAAFRRQVFRERLAATAGGLEHITSYLVFIILLVMWSGLLITRISDRSLLRKLVAICGLLFFWMLVRILRLMLPDGFIDRLCWYLYYIPITFVPTVLLWIGQIRYERDGERFFRWLRRTSFVMALGLALLVMTNDLHQMVFQFPQGMEGNQYEQSYVYGGVYYFIFARSLYLIILFVFMASRTKSGKMTKEAAPLLLVLAGSVIYFGGYAWGIPVFRESDFSVVYGTLSLLFLEIAFRGRMIPNNFRLGEMLHFAPVEMYLITKDLDIQYQTSQANALPPEILSKVGHENVKGTKTVRLSHQDNEGVAYNIHCINGGYMVFVQHMEAVVRLRKTLETQGQEILERNRTLARIYQAGEAEARIKTQKELYDRVTLVLQERIEGINALFAGAFNGKKSQDEVALKKQLGTIKMLVNYCKRRGYLTLLEAGHETCETKALAVWLREALWEAAVLGVEGTVIERGAGIMNAAKAACFYDLFVEIIEGSKKYDSTALLANLEVTDRAQMLHVVLETQPPASPEDFKIQTIQGKHLCGSKTSLEIKQHDEGLKISISMEG